MRASNSHSKALLAFLAMGKKVKKRSFFCWAFVPFQDGCVIGSQVMDLHHPWD